MTAIRKPGKINDNTELIDIGMFGVIGATAVYLVKGEKTCLIDGGTQTEAQALIRQLKERSAFPPDMVIITHSHWDHTQAVPAMTRESEKIGKKMRILASEKAIPNLKDQSFNQIFQPGKYENIADVHPLKEGDIVDLGGIQLEIFDVPGHCEDHIAILDRKHANLFVGDSVGYKIGDGAFIPGFMPPFWDPDEFQKTIAKIKRIPYNSLSMAHYGCIQGDEARKIPDESVAVHETWWGVFEANRDRLDDANILLDLVMNEIRPAEPDIEIISAKLKIMSSLLLGWNRLLKKRPQSVSEFLLKGLIEYLAKGFQHYNKVNATN